ncbi:hypothetical protein JG687_00005707 [Phytophthora cactorum]|uniref:Uncharacterized protein n=1 Tax=Phytophthora cactorum TaxID=29920 RepID=A0A8T1UKD3_9STRA|nr:hypothetical protein JG687_00005707 [Phytophthora cactorum]
MYFILHSSCPASLTLKSTTCDWTLQAWDAITPETIGNCWKHSGKTTSMSMRRILNKRQV